MCGYEPPPHVTSVFRPVLRRRRLNQQRVERILGPNFGGSRFSDYVSHYARICSHMHADL